MRRTSCEGLLFGLYSDIYFSPPLRTFNSTLSVAGRQRWSSDGERWTLDSSWSRQLGYWMRQRAISRRLHKSHAFPALDLQEPEVDTSTVGDRPLLLNKVFSFIHPRHHPTAPHHRIGLRDPLNITSVFLQRRISLIAFAVSIAGIIHALSTHAIAQSAPPSPNYSQVRR